MDRRTRRPEWIVARDRRSRAAHRVDWAGPWRRGCRS